MTFAVVFSTRLDETPSGCISLYQTPSNPIKPHHQTRDCFLALQAWMICRHCNVILGLLYVLIRQWVTVAERDWITLLSKTKAGGSVYNGPGLH